MTNRIEMYLDSSREKILKYIIGNRNVFCHIFSLSFFRYLLLYLRSKLYRQNFIRVLKGLSTTHTESLLKKNYVVGSAGRGGSSDTATAVALHEDGTVASLIEDCRQKSVPVHIRFLLSTIGSKRFIAKVGSVLSSANNYAISLQLAMKRALALVGGVVGSFIAIVVIAVVGPQIKRASWLDSFQTDPHRTQRQRFKMLKIRSMYLNAD